MKRDGNSVNMKSTYHHGDLRSAVISAGLKRLSAGDDLSLRAVARDVGVSATAIYRHFPDKDALLNALAHETADRLGNAQMAASVAAGGGLAGFQACGAAYVTFAIENPALFRLMSARTDFEQRAGDAEVSTAMRFLRESIDGLLPGDADAGQRRDTALHAWSLVHGLALLILDGHVQSSPELIDRVISLGDFVTT